MNAILYERVSSEEQAKKYSLEAQDNELRNYCLVNKIDIIKTFVSHTSGFKFDNEELQQMIDYIEDNYKNIDLILFTERDRLLRDVEIGGYLKYLCLSKNIKLVAINEQIETSENEAKEMFETMTSVFAKFENQRKVRRTLRGKKIKFEIKRQHISKPPTGYVMVKKDGMKVPEPNKDAILIQNLYDDYLAGLGYLKLAKKYNLKYKNSDTFAVVTIKNILHNPFYIGFISRTNPETKELNTIKGNHQPIIKKDVFFRIKGNEKFKSLEQS